MNLYPVETGNFKLDGGAMFGVVPKVMWQKTNPADSNNLCNWAMRSLLIEDGDRLILIDTGIGDKQSELFFCHFYLNGDSTLENSLKIIGFHPEDITDVILTHLHFDHVGGAVKRNSEGFELSFPNAKYWSNKNHWDWAINPNPRERASFLEENMMPIQDSGHLNFINKGDEFGPDISFLMVNGHTESQMIPHIKYKGETIVFAADLIPSVGHIPIPYIPSYDTRPLLSMDEKTKFLKESFDKDYILFLEHDAYNQCCKLKETVKGIRFGGDLRIEDL
jgi:glyoxylase-like metal-dependent hydrolase (beta-lactamase superfamily II)